PRSCTRVRSAPTSCSRPLSSASGPATAPSTPSSGASMTARGRRSRTASQTGRSEASRSYSKTSAAGSPATAPPAAPPSSPTRARNTQAPYSGEGLGGCSTEHAVTLSVRDSAALLDTTSGPGSGDPYAAPPARPFLAEVGAEPGRLRIAFTTKAPNGAPVAP